MTEPGSVPCSPCMRPMEASRSIWVGSPDDLAASLGRDLSGSSFLNGLQRLFYYGFYDLSQVQLSFFESVVRIAPTTLYFPLQDRPAFFFAANRAASFPLADSHEDRRGKEPNGNDGTGRTFRHEHDRGRGGVGLPSSRPDE
jgi:hypothetical protein